MEDDNWTPICNTNTYYCNKQGLIASIKKQKVKLLTFTYSTKLTVRLMINGKTNRYDVHDLIAKTFLPNPNNYSYIKHINGESWDNNVENLEWSETPVKYNSFLYAEQKMRKKVENFDEWRTLAEYPYYYFHKDGMVMGARNEITLLKPIMNPKPCVNIIDEKGEKHLVQLSRLIAAAFVENSNGYTEIIHVDGDVNNIKAENLRWDVNSSTKQRNLKEEIQGALWKAVKEYPGYMVSKEGELVSIHNNVILMTPTKTKRYKTYRITHNDQHFSISIQRLLALAFVENPNNFEHVAFKDCDMMNYKLENLYWYYNPEGCCEDGWKEVKDYPNYEVNTFGVRTKKKKLLLKPFYGEGYDYPSISLKNENGPKTFYIHLIIARNLLPNPENCPIINHKDGDHYNYNLANLEWCTYSQNNKHAWDKGLRNGSTSVNLTPKGDEIWKQLVEYPEYYISNTGLMRTHNDTKIKNLRSKTGYHTLTLYPFTKRSKTILIHRLVAFTFLDRDNNGDLLDGNKVYEVNHKNKIRSDNRVENLEIISIKDHREKDQGKAVFAINLQINDVRQYTTMTNAAKDMNCSITTISNAVKDGQARNDWYYFLQNDPDIENKVDMLMQNM